MIVSHSAIVAFQSCKRKFYYGYLLGYRKGKISDAIETGITGHSFMEEFWKTGTEQGVIDLMAKVGLDRKVALAGSLVLNSIRAGEWNKYEPVDIEQKHTVNLWPGLTVGFTPDGVFYNKQTKEQECHDYKFTGKPWSANRLSMYVQTQRYSKLLNEFEGFSIKRNYLDFFITREDWKDRFKQHEVTPDNKTEWDQIYEDLVLDAAEVAEFAEMPVEEMSRKARRTSDERVCEYCPFVQICKMERQGIDISLEVTENFSGDSRGYGYEPVTTD